MLCVALRNCVRVLGRLEGLVGLVGLEDLTCWVWVDRSLSLG